ncbi:PTS transporter subunit EIIC [Klebsiella oxytoca]|uniref:PTS transporter subunit EIIC n=1 Tax=Klebsiella oxytoca TaxID=571 RepID=UPI001EEC1F06|nr:PTS transporter subunit EIIC [Klebsiella oxytoca]
MSEYKRMAKLALENLGGIDNIKHLSHCATRLRIEVARINLVDIEKIKKIEGVVGVVLRTTQIQIIIGPKVNDAFNAFKDEYESGVLKNNTKNDSYQKEDEKKISYYVDKFATFVAPVFMPVVPAMIVGGMILSIRNLLTNYFGMDINSGSANILLSIFLAAFTFLPVYIGYTVAAQLKMQPIMGAFLGALLLTNGINNTPGLDFLGINIPQVEYGSTILPVILGVFFMYYVDKFLKKLIPEFLVYFVKPLLTMIICVPVLLIILGPLGTRASTAIGEFCLWLGDTMGIYSQPLLAAVYPYMVMFGIDKALMAIGINLVATVGYDPVSVTIGFVSNLAIGGSTLAVAAAIKDNKSQKGMISSFGITALCGVTEPAFYGTLISQPKVLIGTAIGAISGGLVSGILGLKAFIAGGCPGLLTFLYFVDKQGDLYYVFIASIVAIVSITVSFFASRVILKNGVEKSIYQIKKEAC